MGTIQPAVLASILFAMVVPAAAQTVKPTFHNWVLGAPLSEQVKTCVDHGDGNFYKWLAINELCYADQRWEPDTMVYVTVLKGDISYSDDSTLLVMTNSGVPTIEGVVLTLPATRAKDNLQTLREKYGVPACRDNPMRTGIGIPVVQTVCRWAKAWGMIEFQSLTDNIDEMSVEAVTNKLIQFNKRQVETDKKQSEKQF